MTQRKKMALGVCLSLLGALPSYNALAQDTKQEREHRKDMAKLHENMAKCLKSERPMSECKTEMKKSCRDMMGEDGCPMMGEMMHKDHGGMMRGGMMGGDEENQTQDKKSEKKQDK